jgi:hypothetical protein
MRQIFDRDAERFESLFQSLLTYLRRIFIKGIEGMPFRLSKGETNEEVSCAV